MRHIYTKRPRKEKEKFLLRVVKGAFVPADSYTQDRLRSKKYNNGDVVSAVITKPRNVGFHRLAHALGRLVTENVESFRGMNTHAAIKRLQIEANAECESVFINFPGVGPCEYRVPRSISFSDMDQGEFEEFYRVVCRHVAETYWPDLTPEKVAEMAGVMVDE